MPPKPLDTPLGELAFLLSSSPPPFIFITDPVGPRTTAKAVASTLSSLSNDVRFVNINAVTCFTSKLFYDSILNGLAAWTPRWDAGCANWPGTSNFARYNESLDAFIHGIKAVHASLVSGGGPTRLVIAIEQAERLKERLPEIVVPLTRLAELTRVDVTVMFMSAASWSDMRPPLGAAQDPYYVDIPVPVKQTVLHHMTSNFSKCQRENEPNAYHPVLSSAYEKFAGILYDICVPFTNDPDELSYIAASRWPGYIQPILDDHARRIKDDEMDVEFSAPQEDVIMRLLGYFKPTFTAALEQLYPRATDATAWANSNKPTEEALPHIFPGYDITSQPKTGANRQLGVASTRRAINDQYKDLTRMSKFVLLASYLASMNPAKSDLRMFGRGVDEKKRKRRKMARPVKAKPKSGPVKVPQKYLGPAIFPMDRMLAILGALLEDNDNDEDSRAFMKINFNVPGEYTDTELTRVGVYSTIMNLTTAQLLYQTSASDKIDGPPMFKCGISYEVALALAKDVNVGLNDLLWDPM